MDEYELTYIISPQHYFARRDVFLSSANEVHYFYEKSYIKTLSDKLVHRVYPDKTEDYHKKTIKRQLICIGMFVYKHSLETAVDSIEQITNNFYLCERTNRRLSDDQKLETTLKINIGHGDPNKLITVHNQMLAHMNSLIATGITPTSTSSTIAIEFQTKKTTDELNNVYKEMLNDYDIDYDMVGQKFMQITLNSPFKSIISNISRIRPMTINISDVRNETKKGAKIYYSYKPDGYNAFAIVSKRIGYFIFSNGGIVLSDKRGYITNRDALFDEWLFYRSTCIRLNANYILHGELMPNAFIIFAEIPLQRIPTWRTATRSHAGGGMMKHFLHTIKISHKRQIPIDESTDDPPYNTDGIVIVFDSDKAYHKTNIYKVKPPEHNTVDIKLINNKAWAVLSREVEALVLVRCPLVLPHILHEYSPVNTKLTIPIDGTIYECRLDKDASIWPYKTRPDKRVPNSLRAIMASFSALFLPDWLEAIKKRETLGFYKHPARSSTRKNLSKLVHDIIHEFMINNKALRVLDLGGGKLGYLRQIIDIGIIHYLNIDISAYDLWDGIGRIVSNSNGASFFSAISILEGAIQLTSTLLQVPDAWHTSFDTIISIFAFHHFAETDKDIKNSVKLISTLASAESNLLIIMYDYDKVRADMTDILDLGLIQFSTTQTNNRIKVLAEFSSDPFDEPSPSIISIISALDLADFILTSSAHLPAPTYIDDLGNHIPLKIAEYISILTFKKMH